MRSLLPALGCLLLASGAGAEPRVLHMASIAPDGTAWARELRAFSRDVEAQSGGQVKVKWYLGGIAGDEIQALERMNQGQLDGLAGAVLCERIAPALRVMRIPGLLQTREEARFTLAHLRHTVDAQMTSAGVVSLGAATFGNDVIFSRFPIQTMNDLKRARLWVWELDVWREVLPAIGGQAVPSSIEHAGAAYDAGETDGFIAVPSAALVFQWSTRARYYTDVTTSFLSGCIVMPQRVFDALPQPVKSAVRTAAAKFAARFDEISHAMEEQLLGGLFEKQGLKRVPISAEMRREFFAAAKNARDKIGGKLVPGELLQEVLSLLGDYRAEHAESR